MTALALKAADLTSTMRDLRRRGRSGFSVIGLLEKTAPTPRHGGAIAIR